ILLTSFPIAFALGTFGGHQLGSNSNWATPDPGPATAAPERTAGEPSAFPGTLGRPNALTRATAEAMKAPIDRRIAIATDLWESYTRGLRPSAAFEYQRLMGSFRPEDAFVALEAMDTHHAYNRERHWRMCRELILTLGRDQPEQAFHTAVDKWRSGEPEWQKTSHRIAPLFAAWARENPTAAKEWLDDQTLTSSKHRELLFAIIDGTSTSHPSTAVALALELPRDRREDALYRMRDMPVETLLSEATSLTDEQDRADLGLAVLRRTPEPEKQFAIIDRLQLSRSDAIMPLIERAIDRHAEPAEYAEALTGALTRMPEEALPALLHRHVRPWLVRDPQRARAWLTRHAIPPRSVEEATKSFQRPRS
ncbi:MAG: hypothetical protein AAF514_04965, partial [Verrucomicrobiota bacterium]